MSDRIEDQLRRYYDEVVQRVDPRAPTAHPRSLSSRGPRVAFAIAVAVLLGGLLALVLRGRDEVVLPAPTTTVAPVEPSSTSTTTEPTVVERVDAPWTQAEVEPSDVEPLLVELWLRSEARHTCSLLAPTSLGPEGGAAVPRQAGFGPYPEVYVAWDNPDGPGMTGESRLCEDCGRSAIGIHLRGFSGERRLTWETERGVTTLEFSDGSSLSYRMDEDDLYQDGTARLLGRLYLAPEGCEYGIWTSFGEDHLLWLVDQLRFVSDHRALLEDTEPPDQQVIQAGEPPWSGPAMSRDDVDGLLLGRWDDYAADVGDPERTCPLLAFEGLGPDLTEATIRVANYGPWGVAWDNPSGPGHDTQAYPCADCGRGVVLLTGGTGPRPEMVSMPKRIEWSDGSYAEYGYDRMPFVLLPEEQVTVPDRNTGEPAKPAQEAFVYPSDHPNCVYELWSHLGTTHVEFLLGQLRYVEGAP